MIIATCQFPVSGDIRANLGYIERHLRQARKRRADVVHFSECALSGYARLDFKSFAGYDWTLLDEATQRVMDLARELRLWVILGSNRRLTGRHKPHNCLYVINDRGKIADRYDKLFCASDADRTGGDLAHYTPGDRFVLCTIRGVRCGFLICHDSRYPEVFREYQRMGAQLIFHSFHNGHYPKAFVDRYSNLWASVVPALMQSAAACNHLWFSVNNTTRRESCWGSFMVQPDGLIMGQLPRHRTGLLISKIDPKAKYWDPSAPWRSRAIAGGRHSGKCMRDPRSQDKTGL